MQAPLDGPIPVQCHAAGADIVTVLRAATTRLVLSYRLVPGKPVISGNPIAPTDPCAQAGALRVRYAVALDDAGVLQAVTAAPVPRSVDLP